MREVITNIFDNGCKYTEEGKVSLGLTGNDGVVQIYVRDTGAGIPPEDIAHLFQKFYRVDNSATRTLNDRSKLAEFEKTMVQQHSKSPDYLPKAEELMAAEASNPLSTTTVTPSSPSPVSTSAPA